MKADRSVAILLACAPVLAAAWRHRLDRLLNASAFEVSSTGLSEAADPFTSSHRSSSMSSSHRSSQQQASLSSSHRSSQHRGSVSGSQRSSHGVPRASSVSPTDLRGSMVVGSRPGEFVASLKASGTEMESYGRESGVVQSMNMQAKSSQITTVTFIKTPISFVPNSEELATGGRVMAQLVEEIRDEQSKSPGCRFVFCAHVGTTQSVDLKTSRPGFIEGRGRQFKERVEEVMGPGGVADPYLSGQADGYPFEHFNCDRFAGLIMKAYLGTTPPCFEGELSPPPPPPKMGMSQQQQMMSARPEIGGLSAIEEELGSSHGSRSSRVPIDSRSGRPMGSQQQRMSSQQQRMSSQQQRMSQQQQSGMLGGRSGMVSGGLQSGMLVDGGQQNSASLRLSQTGFPGA